METISVKARRSKKAGGLVDALSRAGFDNVREGATITCEKYQVEDLKGTKSLDYSLSFSNDAITLSYSVLPKDSRNGRLLKLLPLFFDSLELSKAYYEVDIASLLSLMHDLVVRLEPVIDKEALDFSQELSLFSKKYDDLSKRYQELLRSSEENARVLLECERRRDELESRVKSLESLSDEVLKEELYKWVVAHNGSIDIEQFCTAYVLSSARVEEGIALLVKEGYLKRVG